MAKHPFRDALREDPATVAVGLALVVLVLVPGYLAVAVLRPRWLTADARRSP